MYRELALGIISSALFSTISWFVARFWYSHRNFFWQERSKLTYYRVIRLAIRDRGDRPYYSHVHHQVIDLAEPPTEVFDESWCLNASLSKFPEIHDAIKISSIGVVDAVQILPIVAQNTDNHPHTRTERTKFTAESVNKITRLMTVGTLFNGIQSKKDWWFATTAQREGQSLVLVVDFASLPFGREAIREMHATVTRNGSIVTKESIAANWFEERIADDIYIARLTNAKKNDVIKIDFTLDIDRVPRRSF